MLCSCTIYTNIHLHFEINNLYIIMHLKLYRKKLIIIPHSLVLQSIKNIFFALLPSEYRSYLEAETEARFCNLTKFRRKLLQTF